MATEIVYIAEADMDPDDVEIGGTRRIGVFRDPEDAKAAAERWAHDRGYARLNDRDYARLNDRGYARLNTWTRTGTVGRATHGCSPWGESKSGGMIDLYVVEETVR